MTSHSSATSKQHCASQCEQDSHGRRWFRNGRELYGKIFNCDVSTGPKTTDQINVTGSSAKAVELGFIQVYVVR